MNNILYVNSTKPTFDDILENVSKILNLEGADKIFMPIIKSKYNDIFFKLVENLLLTNSGYYKLYFYLKNIFYENKDLVIPYLYEAIKYLNDNDIFMNCTEVFLVKATKTGLIDELKSLFMNQTISKDISDTINLTNYNGNVIKNELFKRPEIICGFLDLMYNRTIFELLFQIFKYLKSKEYIEYKLPKMLSLIYDYKPKLAKQLLEVTAVILQQLITQKEVTNFITMEFTRYLNNSFFYEKFKYYNISDECYNSMYTIFFKNVEHFYSFNQEMDYQEAIKPLKEMRSFFLKKVIIDSTKDKNDFLTYENCLEKKFDDSTLKNFRFNFTFQPIYIIAMFDDLDNKTTLYDSIFIEKYNYWLGYCLPYGTFNNQSTEICSQNDYSNILRIFMEIPFDMRTANVNSFILDERKFTVGEYLIGLLYLITIFIPLIIKLILYIYTKECRPWGYYCVIASGNGFAAKIIHVNPGQKLSVQSHNHRSEHWVVISGQAKVFLDGKEYILNVGESIDIPIKSIHSLQCVSENDLEIVEVQFGKIISEDDIIRYEDMYGRV